MNEIARPTGIDESVIPPGLTDDEANFVYNVEVVGLPPKKAAQLAGMPASKMYAAHIVQARELARNVVRGSCQVTKEDVTLGIKGAIDRARILSEPMTEIIGWEKLAKLHGLDEPQKVNINVNESIKVVTEHVRSVPDADLVRLLGAGDVVDVEFYESGK